jgi:hypothetical protein
LPSDIEHLDLWRRYVGPTWGELIQALDNIAFEDLSTSGGALRSAAARMATWVSQSLQHIGFRHVRSAAGEAFYIDRFDFPAVRR